MSARLRCAATGSNCEAIVDNGGFTGLLRHGIKRGKIEPASAFIAATPRSAIFADSRPLELHVMAATPPSDVSAEPQPVQLHVIAATPASKISAEPQPAALNTIAAPPPIEISPNLQQAQLHTNGCGDFTLMALENWLDLRGYPEFDTFSMHLDSIFCFSAHYSGVVEEVLEEPLRIYHIEHGTGSAWTPEGRSDRLGETNAKTAVPHDI